MSTPLVLVMPQPDYTGSNPDYLSVNEEQDLIAKNSLIFVLNYGAFYADSLVIIDTATGTILKPGKNEDYTTGMLDPIATAKSGKTVNCVIELNKTKFPTKPILSVTYQFVGGPYQLNTAALQQAVDDLETQPDTVYWDNILGKPVAYPPSFHTHKAADITHLDSTNAALWAIKQSIDHLAEVQADETVPADMVRYGGVTKYTIDKGINLIDYVLPTLNLQFPRSLSENAIFALRITFLTKGREYHLKVYGTEAVLGGFTFSAIETDISNVVGLDSATLTTLDGKNYLELHTNLATHPEGWGTGFLVVENVVVWCDKTEEYNAEYAWLSTPARSRALGADEPIVEDVSIINNSIADLTETHKNHKVLVDNGFGFANRTTPLILRFPRGKVDTHYVCFTIDIFRTTKESITVMGLEDPAEGYISAAYVTNFNPGNDYQLAPLKFDADYGYFILNTTDNNLGTGYVLVSDVTVSGTEQALYSQGWEWDVANAGANMGTSPFIGDARAYQHGHSQNEITGLPQALSSKLSKVEINRGTILTPTDNLYNIVNSGHYYPDPSMTAQQFIDNHYPVFKDGFDGAAGQMIVERTYGLIKQMYYCANGRYYVQYLSIDETIPDNPSGTLLKAWRSDSKGIVGAFVNHTYHYEFNLEPLDKNKYYLVEFVLSGLDATKLTNKLPIGVVNIQATYNPDVKTGLTNGKLLGSCFGQLQYGANSNLGPYFDIKGIMNHIDTSLFAFSSFFVCPVDNTSDKLRVWLYVKGSGRLHVYTDAEDVKLHEEASVIVGVKADSSNVTTANAVTTPTPVAGEWIKLCDVKINQATTGFPAPV